MSEEADKKEGVEVSNKKGILTVRIPDKTILALLLAIGSIVWGRIEQWLADLHSEKEQKVVVSKAEKLEGAQALTYKLLAVRLDEAFERLSMCEDGLEEVVEFVDRKHVGRPVIVHERPALPAPRLRRSEAGFGLGSMGSLGRGGGGGVASVNEEDADDKDAVMGEPEADEVAYGNAELPNFADVMQQKVNVEEALKRRVPKK